jgi:hypothetical protein
VYRDEEGGCRYIGRPLQGWRWNEILREGKNVTQRDGQSLLNLAIEKAAKLFWKAKESRTFGAMIWLDESVM